MGSSVLEGGAWRKALRFSAELEFLYHRQAHRVAMKDAA